MACSKEAIRESSCAAAASAGSICIWDVDDLVLHILQRLPTASIIAARLVCQRWRKLAPFHRSPHPCCYICARAGAARMYDPVMKTWIKVAAPPDLPPNSYRKPIPSHGNSGLVAVAEWDNRHAEAPCFWVGNPMLDSWRFVQGPRELAPGSWVPPEPPYLGRVGVAGVIGGAGNQRFLPPEKFGFLFVVVSEGPPARFQIVGYAPEHRMVVYDSGAGRWALGSWMPPGFSPAAAAAAQQHPAAGGRACALFLGYGLRTSGRGTSALHLLSFQLDGEHAGMWRMVAEVAGALGAGKDREVAQGLVFVPGQELPLVLSLSRVQRRHRVPRLQLDEFWRRQAPGAGWRVRVSAQLPGLQGVRVQEAVETRPRDASARALRRRERRRLASSSSSSAASQVPVLDRDHDHGATEEVVTELPRWMPDREVVLGHDFWAWSGDAAHLYFFAEPTVVAHYGAAEDRVTALELPFRPQQCNLITWYPRFDMLARPSSLSSCSYLAI